MNRSRWYAVGLGTVIAAVIIVVAFGWTGLRLAGALALCLVLPGLGWARRMKPGDGGDTLALTVVLSVCATVTVSTTMVLLDRWSWTVGAGCLLAIAAIGFVPDRRLLGGVALRTRWRLSTRRIGFEDWHAAYAERRRLRTAEAAPQWTDWYADQQLADEMEPDDQRTEVLSFPAGSNAESSNDRGGGPEKPA
jgi:hypothetical protein